MNPRHLSLNAIMVLLLIPGGYAIETTNQVATNQVALSSCSPNNIPNNSGKEVSDIKIYYPIIGAFLIGITGSLLLAALTSIWSVGWYRQTLKKRFRDGDEESSLLLTAEARELIDDQRSVIRESAGRIIQLENQINRLVKGHSETIQIIVDDFKSKLNKAFESLAVQMQNVVDSSEVAKNEVAKSGKVLEQTVQLLDKKEKEISILKEGFQKALIKPVILSYIEMRDDFVSELGQIIDDGFSSSLKKNVEKVDVVLNKIGMIKMEVPEDPHSLPSHFWDTLEAAKVTGNESINGKTSRVVRDGYYSKIIDANGQPHDIVFRKAIVEIYRYEPKSTENR